MLMMGATGLLSWEVSFLHVKYVKQLVLHLRKFSQMKSIYYHIPSLKEYLSFEKRLQINDIDLVNEILHKISSDQDKVTVFDEKNYLKINFWNSNKIREYELEVISPAGVLNYNTNILENEIEALLNLLSNEFKAILNAPGHYGFDSESL